MKFIAKTLLILIGIPLIIVCMISVNIKFQLLSSGFWIKTFESGNVYSQVSTIVENRLIERVEAEGGMQSDVKVLSDLISPQSLKTVFERNIESVLLYANGKTSEMSVFVPLSLGDALEGRDYYNLDNFSEKMTFAEFLEKFNIGGVKSSDIEAVSKFGLQSTILIITSFVALLLIFALMYLATGSGKRLIAPAVALTMSGLIILGSSFGIGYMSRTLTTEFTDGTNIGASLITVFAPPVIQNLMDIWIWFGASSLVLGIAALFIRKPAKKFKAVEKKQS